jgi:hypothetical protein
MIFIEINDKCVDCSIDYGEMATPKFGGKFIFLFEQDEQNVWPHGSCKEERGRCQCIPNDRQASYDWTVKVIMSHLLQRHFVRSSSTHSNSVTKTLSHFC